MVSHGGIRQNRCEFSEAIKLLAACVFDVLIADLGLSSVAGHEIVAQAQAQWPDMQIVIATGCAPDWDEKNGPTEDRVRYLIKP